MDGRQKRAAVVAAADLGRVSVLAHILVRGSMSLCEEVARLDQKS